MFSLTIENQNSFRTLVENLRKEVEDSGSIILSENNKILPLNKNIDILDNFCPFNINTKQLISKINASLEQIAIDESHYLGTEELLSLIRKYIDNLCEDSSFTVECGKLSIGSLLKYLSLSIANDDDNSLETVLNYMNIISEFGKSPLFIMLNMRCFYSDSDMESFSDTVRKKQYKVMLLENIYRKPLSNMPNLIIDNDLCEI